MRDDAEAGDDARFSVLTEVTERKTRALLLIDGKAFAHSARS